MNESANNVINYYENFNEKDRLSSNWGQIELIRTKEIIEQYIPDSPAVVLDVGGASGTYSCWLAKKGYELFLVDPVPKHLEQAKLASKNQPDYPITGFHIGDARSLNFPDSFADAVLLMGPMYHLLALNDRLDALREAYRVLRTGGVLFAVGISRFSSSIDGLVSEYFKDPNFQKIMIHDLESGRHINHTDKEQYFTDAYFHRPEELSSEIKAVGFQNIQTHAVEGISYMMEDFNENWDNPEYREFLLSIIRKIDQEPSLMGASPHVMCVAEKNRLQSKTKQLLHD